MTPRERILKTINHERPDRIPAVLAARAEVNRGLLQHYGVDSMDEVHSILGTDGWGGAGVDIDFSDYNEEVNGRLEGDCPYAGREYIIHDENTFEDGWGVIRRKGSDGKYVQWITGPLADAEDPDEYVFPGPDRLVDSTDLAERVRRQKEEGKFLVGGVAMPFKRAWELRGLEKLLADYAINPGFVERLYDNMLPLYEETLVRVTRAGVDMIGIGGDGVMQDRIIVGPDRFRAIDKPRLAAMISRCKDINPDLHVFIHSDGNMWDIMDDLIEIWFDVIDPIQPECMDPVEIKERYGDRIVLHGCGSIQRTLPFGTVDDVRHEVTRLIEKCGYNGGLVLRPSNAINFDTPIENVVAFFETARDYEP